MNGEKPINIQFNPGHLGDMLLGIEKRLPLSATKRMEEAQEKWEKDSIR